jgi:hypothetical protein
LGEINVFQSNLQYSTVRTGKNLSANFLIQNGLKQGEALSPFLLNVALQYAIRRIKGNQEGLKLNETHQLSAYADEVSIVGENTHTIKKTQKLY